MVRAWIWLIFPLCGWLQQQNTASNMTGSFAKLAVRRNQTDSASLPASSDDSQVDNPDKGNPTRRSSSASLTGNLPPLGRKGGQVQPCFFLRNCLTEVIWQSFWKVFMCLCRLTPIGQTRNSAASSRSLEASAAGDYSAAEELGRLFVPQLWKLMKKLSFRELIRLFIIFLPAHIFTCIWAHLCKYLQA